MARKRHTLLSAALSLALGASLAAQESLRVDAHLRELVTHTLDASRTPEERAQLRRAFEELDPSQAAGIVELWTYGLLPLEEGQPPRALDGSARDLLVETLRAWPERTAVAGLRAALQESSPLERRLAVLELLGEFAGAQGLPDLFAVLRELDGGQASDPRVLGVFVASLERVLSRDEASFRVVEDELERADARLTRACLGALGRSGDWRGLSVLEDHLGRTPDLDRELLEALSDLDLWRQEEARKTVLRWAFERLDAEDAKLRAQAARTLATLRGGTHLEDVLGLLDDDDRRVRRSAHFALQELTGLRWDEQPQRWHAWLEREDDWRRQELPTQAETLLGPASGPALEALRGFAEHATWAAETAPLVLRALEHGDEEVAVRGLQVLARLAEPASIAPLVQLLETERRPRVREALASTLTQLTGHEAPDAGAWSAWLAGSEPENDR